MNNVVHMPNAHDWKYFANKIAAAWSKQAASIVEAGQLLIEGKEELEHGSFESMIKLRLPFSPTTARRLVVIAKHPIISNQAHGPVLPPSYRTLYELTKIEHKVLREKLADGTINPKMERSQVMELRGEVTAGIIEAVRRSKNGLTSDEVRAAIGDRAPAATVRGVLSKLATRSELIRSDEWRDGRKGKPG
jgi:hypothetical protein